MSQLPVVLAAVSAFVITAVTGYFLIPFLKRLHYGQTIKEIGPTWHKDKGGTPTMGGIMFIIGIVVATALGACTLFWGDKTALQTVGAQQWSRLIYGILMALGFGFVGFLDDYISVVKKRNMGLRAREKFLLQLLIGAVYLMALYFSGSRSTALRVPFFGAVELGWLYWPVAIFIIVGTVNAVNLTDGIDGLSGSVTFVVALGFLVLSGILGYAGFTLLAAAVAGGCIGYLLYNFHPAKVFMGDTGSLFLGGIVVAMAFGIGLPVVLVFTGIVYICETLSDIIQIGCYKLTHKRVFKMAPIHHHFEMSGWSEVKIVTVFSLVALAGCVLAVFWVLGM